jgi:hypothetical protein
MAAIAESRAGSVRVDRSRGRPTPLPPLAPPPLAPPPPVAPDLPPTNPPKDDILREAVSLAGRHWTHIQSLHFPGRSKNAIKNRCVGARAPPAPSHDSRYSVITRRLQKQTQEQLPAADNGTDTKMVRCNSCSSDADQDESASHDSGEDEEMDDPPEEMAPAENLNWLQYDCPSWSFDAASNDLTHSLKLLESTGPSSTASVDDVPAGGKFSPLWGSDVSAPAPVCPLPADPFQPPGIMDYGGHSLGISPLGRMMPDASQVQEEGMVQFTLEMNRPSVDTMQQLVRIAIETQARFKVERE